MTRLGWITLLACVAVAATVAPSPAKQATPAQGSKPVHGIYDFHVKTIHGADTSLAVFKGRTVLIVNTASKCGFTPQYESLETLYQKYHAQGFEVLAFPANNFNQQEPGTDAEIQTFCTLNYQTTFPLFSKISVKGDGIAPLYTYLTRSSPFPGDIEWNFTKFLVGRDGKVIARFSSKVDPLAKDVTDRLETALAAK